MEQKHSLQPRLQNKSVDPIRSFHSSDIWFNNFKMSKVQLFFENNFSKHHVFLNCFTLLSETKWLHEKEKKLPVSKTCPSFFMEPGI